LKIIVANIDGFTVTVEQDVDTIPKGAEGGSSLGAIAFVLIIVVVIVLAVVLVKRRKKPAMFTHVCFISSRFHKLC